MARRRRKIVAESQETPSKTSPTIGITNNIIALKERREELFCLYRDKCDRFIVYLEAEGEKKINLEERKKGYAYTNLSVEELLPKKLVTIEHQGPLTIFAFSDYRIHEFEPVLEYLDKLEAKPDLIVYAGDDVERFAPVPLDALRIPSCGEEYCEELVKATRLPRFGFILTLPKHFDERSVHQRLSFMLNLIQRLREAIKTQQVQSLKQLKQFLAGFSPSLKPEVTHFTGRQEVIIKDESTKTTVLKLRMDPSIRIDIIRGSYLTLYYRCGGEVPPFVKVGESRERSYYYIPINQPSRNYFEELSAQVFFSSSVFR